MLLLLFKLLLYCYKKIILANNENDGLKKLTGRGKTRRLNVPWEEVNVETICPPSSGGFHLFDGERDAAIPIDSIVTESAVLVPRQVVNTRSAARLSREANPTSQLPARVNDSNEIDLGEFESAADSDGNDGVVYGDNELENINPHDMFEPRARRHKSRHQPEHFQLSNPKVFHLHC